MPVDPEHHFDRRGPAGKAFVCWRYPNIDLLPRLPFLIQSIFQRSTQSTIEISVLSEMIKGVRRTVETTRDIMATTFPRISQRTHNRKFGTYQERLVHDVAFHNFKLPPTDSLRNGSNLKPSLRKLQILLDRVKGVQTAIRVRVMEVSVADKVQVFLKYRV